MLPWTDGKNWPIADRREPRNDRRNNYATHFGFSSWQTVRRNFDMYVSEAFPHRFIFTSILTYGKISPNQSANCANQIQSILTFYRNLIFFCNISDFGFLHIRHEGSISMTKKTLKICLKNKRVFTNTENSTIFVRIRAWSLLFSSNLNFLLLSNWAPWNNREKSERMRSLFSATFSWTSPLSDRKVPIKAGAGYKLGIRPYIKRLGLQGFIRSGLTTKR